MSRVVMITGAGRRIGRALALGFAGRGSAVVVHYGSSADAARRTLHDVESLGARGMLVQADVRDRSAVRGAVERAVGEFGRIDVLVNNAGIYPPPKSLEDTTEELWREVIETNLYGEFFAAQAVAESMQGNEPDADGIRGRIINISSLGAFQIWRDRVAYNVSKAGVVQLTRSLSRMLAPSITVNSVAPGAIAIPEEPAPGAMIAPSRIPMARHGTTDDIFNAVKFFAEDATYITGQTLVVDGGLVIAQEASQE